MKKIDNKNCLLSVYAIETGNTYSEEHVSKLDYAMQKGCNFFDVTSSQIYEQKIIEKIPNDNNEKFYIAKNIDVNQLKELLKGNIPKNPEQEQKKYEYLYYIDLKNFSMTKIINEIQKIKSHSKDIKLGISEANKTEINAINEVYPLTFVKNDYSILNYSYEEEMKLCVSKGIHFFASSPFKNYNKGKRLILDLLNKKEKEAKSEEERKNEKKNRCCCSCCCSCSCSCNCDNKDIDDSMKIKIENYSLGFTVGKNVIPLINLNELKNEHSEFITTIFTPDELKNINDRIKGKSFITSECILSGILIVCSLAQFIFGIYILKIIDSSEIIRNISNDLIDNFNTGYFMNFSKCPSPYDNTLEQNKRRLSDNLISFGKWEGMKRGCGKKNNNNFEVRVLKDEENCEENEKLLQPISARELYIFKGISICGVTKANYYDLLFSNDSIVKKDQDCPNGKKLCGYIDTIKNKLCLDEDKECPISYVSFSESPPSNISNLKYIEGKGINLYYSNNPYENSNEIPYITNTFKIFNNIICSIPNLYSFEDLYALDGFNKTYADKCVIKEDFRQEYTRDFGDRYHQLHQIDSYALYKENKIIDDLERSELINYGLNTSKYKNNLLYLYVRTHYGFDKECLEKNNIKLNLQVLSKIFATGDKMRVYAFFLLASCLSIFAYISNLVSLCKKSKGGCNDNIWLYSCLEFVKLSFALGKIIYESIAITFDDPYEKKMTCSDFVTNDNYNIMIYHLNKAGNYIFYLIIGIIVFVSLDIVSFIIFVIIKCKELKYDDFHDLSDINAEKLKKNKDENQKNQNNGFENDVSPKIENKDKRINQNANENNATNINAGSERDNL